MKYQITCDNCGTQFIIEAEQGQTVECKCPHCHGVMDITLPLVTGARQYGEQPVKNIQSGNFRPQPMSKFSGPEKTDHTVLIGVIAGLVLVGLAIGAYFLFGQKHEPTEPDPTSAVVDTIPYQIETEPTYEPPIDTAVVPSAPEDIEQVQTQEEHHVTDTASTKPSSEEDAKIDATPKDNETTDINQ